MTEVLGEEICPNATLSTADPKRTDLVHKPTLHDDRPATNPFNSKQLYFHLALVQATILPAFTH